MQDFVQPNFMILDSKGREAFLSQMGNFSPAERRIFHRLAGMWAPVIAYQTVLAYVNSESVTGKNDLHSLMDKMKAAHCGMISTHIQQGERVPLGIVLCDPDGSAYYSRLLEELLLDVATDLLKPLPGKHLLDDLNHQLPQDLITMVDYQELALIHGEKEGTDNRMVGIEASGKIFFFNSSSIKRFVTIALAKLQNILQNATLLSYFAQKRNQSLLELKGLVEARSPNFWTEFCSEILVAKDVLKQQKKVALDPQFFAMAEFILNFLSSQKDELMRKKKLEEERRMDMHTIVETLRSSENFFKGDGEFTEILIAYKKKYTDSFTQFRDEFEKAFLEPPPKKALPVIVHLGRAYIHQEKVHPFFIMRLELIGKELFNHYVKVMEQYIKFRDDTESAVFYSRSNFEADIAERVKNMDPALFELLQRPSLVAEAVILSIRKHKEIKGADDLKSHLSPFFQNERIVFKDMSKLFGLNLADIYKIAFIQLSLFRQIINRVTGKYELFLHKFDELSEGFLEEAPAREKRSARKEESLSHEERKSRLAAEQHGSGKSSSASKSTSASRNSSKEKTPLAPAVPEKKTKTYSNTEQESAWKAFQDQILR